VDGDKCVCQTNAIFLYIGEKYGLGGSTPDEKLSNTQLLDEIYDVRNAMIETVYPFKQVCRSQEEFQKKVDSHAEAPPLRQIRGVAHQERHPLLLWPEPTGL